MAEVAKYQLLTNNNNNNSLLSELKTQFSVFQTRKSSTFIYGVVLIFVIFTVFLAFSPSSDGFYRSTFSSVYSCFFSNNSTQFPNISQNNATFQVPILNNSQNLDKTHVFTDKVANFEQNNTQISSKSVNYSATPPQISSNSTKKGGGMRVKSSDFSTPVSKNQVSRHGNKEGGELVGCDLYDGEWVRDEYYPLYKPGSCKLIDEHFNCFLNGRPDFDYFKLKWKPKACSIPRLDAGHMLELLRGKRLVFVGDSLNRNMWESLVCILRNKVKNKKKVYETFGQHRFPTEASYSYVFKDYNCTIEFFVSPFLVQQWEVNDKNGTTKETLRIDQMVLDAEQYRNADYIVFNTGHWWTHDKTSKGEDYYQEGNHVYEQLDVKEAFRRAITTWARWIDANINPQQTHVLFRGYSASHFSGGQWNSGGKCDSETEPIRNETYLTQYPWKMKVLESVLNGMKTPVSFLNVTRLTDYRKDGHPSIYRKQHFSKDDKRTQLEYQDCSHWCLPGVPDSWNELLYAELLRKQYKDQILKNKTSALSP